LDKYKPAECIPLFRGEPEWTMAVQLGESSINLLLDPLKRGSKGGIVREERHEFGDVRLH
jgi:hypothetical protein